MMTMHGFFFIWLYMISHLQSHDLHLSRCEVDQSVTDQSLQISAHIFIDDLELAIREELRMEELYLGTEREAIESDSLIWTYLSNHLQFELDGVANAYEFIGKELSQDFMALWVYLEIPNVMSFEELKMYNSILTHLYDDQKNMIQLRLADGKKQYFLFDDKKLEAIVHP